MYRNREVLNDIINKPTGNFDFLKNFQLMLTFMKRAKTLEELFSRSIELNNLNYSEFRLVPVSEVNQSNPDVINSFYKWRVKYANLFSNSNEISLESTQKWVKDSLLQNKDRILFLLVNKYGKEVAHLGLWCKENGVIELDNLVKGADDLPKGLMSDSVKTLCAWAYEYLSIHELKLRVLESNTNAIEFYKKIGFKVVGREKMKWVEKNALRLLENSVNDSDSNEAWVTMSIRTGICMDNPEMILTAGPSIGPIEVSLVSDAVRTGWNDFNSDYLNKFTQNFSDFIDAKYVIPTDSCTSALHMALWSLGIGPGDEVIVPETTWVATANAVKYVGATPIFADVDKETWCINPESIETLITNKTRAVMPVHLYGYVGNLSKIEKICRNNSLYLVQDAAPGIGSLFNDKSVATYGDISCFSFQGAKLLVSGEGGVLTTNSKEIYEKAYKVGDSGRRPGTFWIDSYGKKMKMSNPTAALAVAQLQSAERQISQKRQIRDWYKEFLVGVDGLAFQIELPNTRSICWMTSILIDRKDFNREDFRAKLLDLKIDTRPVFPAISQYPIWNETRNPQPVARWIGENALNLPSGVRLTKNSIERVCETIKKLL